MTERGGDERERLARIEAGIEDIRASLGALSDRIDVMQQEAQRCAAQLNRVGLNQESFKLAGERRDQALREVAEALLLVKSALEKRLR